MTAKGNVYDCQGNAMYMTAKGNVMYMTVKGNVMYMTVKGYVYNCQR